MDSSFAYYALVAAIGMLVITPLAWMALNTRRAAAMTFKPVSVGWDLRPFAGLNQSRMRMYRLHPSSASKQATHEIRDDTGKRIGRIAWYRYEPPTIELNGTKYRIYDQSDRKLGVQWRGRVGGESDRSIVLHAEGKKPVAEVFRSGGFLKSGWDKISISRGSVDIEVPPSRKQPFEFRFDEQTVARVVRPDPTGVAPVTYVAMAARATPEFAAAVLYLSSQRH